jgi:hypothetical protein
MLRKRMREELRKRELLQMLSNKSSDSTCTGIEGNEKECKYRI